jgi:hypothetical protein
MATTVIEVFGRVDDPDFHFAQHVAKVRCHFAVIVAFGLFTNSTIALSHIIVEN